MSPSFAQFLQRAQEKIDYRNKWVCKMKQIKDTNEIKNLKAVPDILRGSREKLQPLYERCIVEQKQRDRRMEHKRIEKERTEAEKVSSLTFQPCVNHHSSKRTFE